MITRKLNWYYIRLLVFSLLFIFGPTLSLAKTIVLEFAHPYPATHTQHQAVLFPWAKKVEEACNGALKIKFIPGVHWQRWDRHIQWSRKRYRYQLGFL